MARGALAIDDFVAARRYQRSRRIVSTMLLGGGSGVNADEQRIQRWLDVLLEAHDPPRRRTL